MAPTPTRTPMTAVRPRGATYRENTEDPEFDSQSSSSNSPARADYEESDFFAGNNDSQSSIGVPAFQDMAVAEEESCVPPIYHLPAEVLIAVFSKISSPQDLLSCMLVSKKWARNAVDLLWHRPACVTWPKHGAICRTLTLEDPYFAYRDFIKRLNLASLAERVNDGSIVPLSICTRVERLTLTSCVGLTDNGLKQLVMGNDHLLALDVSGVKDLTEVSMQVVAENCKRLQGLNISGCDKISNEAMIMIAESCKYIKRVSTNTVDLLPLLLTQSSLNSMIVVNLRTTLSWHLQLIAETFLRLISTSVNLLVMRLSHH